LLWQALKVDGSPQNNLNGIYEVVSQIICNGQPVFRKQSLLFGNRSIWYDELGNWRVGTKDDEQMMFSELIFKNGVWNERKSGASFTPNKNIRVIRSDSSTSEQVLILDLH
jgi:hypothetical protein